MIKDNITAMFFLNPVRVEYGSGETAFVYIDYIKELIYDCNFQDITKTSSEILSILAEKKKQLTSSISVKDGPSVYKTPAEMIGKIYKNIQKPLEDD